MDMAKQDTAWVIDDDQSIRWVLEKALQKAGITVRTFDSAANVPDALKHAQPDVILSDIRMPGVSGLELLEAIGRLVPDVPVIIMTAHSDLESAVASYRGGAFEYLPKPFDMDEAVRLARRAIEHRRRQKPDSGTLPEEVPEIVGEAPAMQEVFRAIGRLSRSNITVLINGESGTGKELVARALHRHSPRANGPFIALNIAAIPRELLESELFGHEKGAFTGAAAQRKGRFEQAHAGTLFLDEIGDMPAELQTRLLRVLSDGRFYRVGGHEQVETDVRIIAATNQDLETRVKDGRFREDLFHRLNVIRIHLPPLRERREDLPAFLEYFLGRFAAEMGRGPPRLSPEAERLLLAHDWPGNVRELANAVERAVTLSDGDEVHPGVLPPALRGSGPGAEAESASTLPEAGIDLQAHLDTIERRLLERALERTGGVKTEAARLLSLTFRSLRYRLAKYGILGER
jgi:two-component system nitrogen regulation response regulator GlnG